MKQKSLFLFLLFAMMSVLAACGGGGEDINQDTGMEESAGESAENGDDTTTEEGNDDSVAEEGNGDAATNTINISATNWEFDKEEYTVKTGEPVTLNFTNEEGAHGLAIEGTDVNIQQDGQQEVTLEPGEYKIYCSIPCGQGHASMTAALVVQ